jgi:hypothetical protein
MISDSSHDNMASQKLQVFIETRVIDSPEAPLADAAHLALASVAGADYLLTWNCRHLARDGVRRGLAELNQSAGVGIPHLVTPEDLMEVEDGAIS